MPDATVILSIAGSDPSGGAGMQADLKTFAAMGAYGAAAIAALTAQNTTGVQGVQLVDPAFVAQQVESVFDDLPVAAVKTGMLGNAAIIAAVADAIEAQLDRTPGLRVVVDPVMVARSGDRLLDPKAVAVLRDRLLPLANLVDPEPPRGQPADRDRADRGRRGPPPGRPRPLRAGRPPPGPGQGRPGPDRRARPLDRRPRRRSSRWRSPAPRSSPARPTGPAAPSRRRSPRCSAAATTPRRLRRRQAVRLRRHRARPRPRPGHGPLDHLWLRRIDDRTRVRDDAAIDPSLEAPGTPVGRSACRLPSIRGRRLPTNSETPWFRRNRPATLRRVPASACGGNSTTRSPHRIGRALSTERIREGDRTCAAS